MLRPASYFTTNVRLNVLVAFPDVAVTAIMEVPAGVPVWGPGVGVGTGVEPPPPPQAVIRTTIAKAVEASTARRFDLAFLKLIASDTARAAGQQ